MDCFGTSLQRAAGAVALASTACRDWENGGDADAVADTASEADGAITELLEAVAGIDPALKLDAYPETRLGRFALAARLLVLAGTDEGGESQDLAIAAQLLTAAAAS
jgi:hypothetical protein